MVQIAGKPFTQLTNLNILDELRIQGILVNPGGGSKQVRVSAEYSQLIDDDQIIGTGTFDVNLISLSIAVKPITIRAKAGTTLTLVPAGSDTVEAGASPVTANTSVTLVPDITSWLQI